MYGTILTSVSLLVVLVEVIAVCIADGILEDSSLKNIIKFKRIIRTVLLVELVVFNFLFSFAKPIIVFQLVLQITMNVISIAYFFVDYFYFSQRTRLYILWLQSKVFDGVSFSKLFKVYESNGIEYKELKKIRQQRFSIVMAGKDKGKCILIPSRDGDLLLKPKIELDEQTLVFYAQKIEIDMEGKESLRFYYGCLPEEAIKEYDFGAESKIYLWIKNRLLSSKGKLISGLIVAGLIMITLFTMIIISEVTGFDFLNDWLAKPI